MDVFRGNFHFFGFLLLFLVLIVPHVGVAGRLHRFGHAFSLLFLLLLAIAAAVIVLFVILVLQQGKVYCTENLRSFQLVNNCLNMLRDRLLRFLFGRRGRFRLRLWFGFGFRRFHRLRLGFLLLLTLFVFGFLLGFQRLQIYRSQNLGACDVSHRFNVFRFLLF